MLRGATNPSIGKHDPRMLSDFEFKSSGFCETGYDSRAPQTLSRHPVTKVYALIEYSISMIHGPWQPQPSESELGHGGVDSQGARRNSSVNHWTAAAGN